MASYADRGSVVNGAARRTSVNRASTSHSSTAVIATTCWASTSRGLVGTRSASIAPLRMRSTATAVCTRSPRCLGSSTPRETSPTWWPARPTRCSPEATDGGDSICTTRSTAPMSMPSSRLDVATTQGSRPRLRSSSIRARCSLETDPWWARAITGGVVGALRLAGLGHHLGGCAVPPGPGLLGVLGGLGDPVDAVGGDLVEPRGQPLGEPAGVGEDDRGAVLLDQVDHALLDVRPDRPAALGAAGGGALAVPRRRRPRARARSCPRPARRPGGPTPWSRRARRPRPGAEPPRKRATSSTGRTVADRPIRCAGGVSSSSSSRSSESARWAPRLVPATACTSSTITVSTPRSDSRACEVSIRNSDSGVVIRMSGGVGAEPAPVGGAGVAGADADGDVGGGHAEPVGGVPDAGQRRAQVALDVDGQRLERGDVEHPAALPPSSGGGAAGQPVERPQERRERLAGAGRGDDQGVAAGGDRLPGAHLGAGSGGERGLEPGAGGLAEGRGAPPPPCRVASSGHPLHPAGRHRQVRRTTGGSAGGGGTESGPGGNLAPPCSCRRRVVAAIGHERAHVRGSATSGPRVPAWPGRARRK